MKLNELSKDELISMIINCVDISFDDELHCSSCGPKPTKYMFVCDECSAVKDIENWQPGDELKEKLAQTWS